MRQNKPSLKVNELLEQIMLNKIGFVTCTKLKGIFFSYENSIKTSVCFNYSIILVINNCINKVMQKITKSKIEF